MPYKRVAQRGLADAGGSVLHVACAARGRYVKHSAAMLHSVLEQRGCHRVRVHYMHGDDLTCGSGCC